MADPKAGNGGVTEKYSWTQTLSEVNVVIGLRDDLGTIRKADVKIDIKRKALSVKVKGEDYVVGEFYRDVRNDDSFWQLDSNDRTVTLFLEKVKNDEWWSCVVLGDDEIDTSKVEPENSKLDDLDGESRAMVEKMMLEQRQKAALERGFKGPQGGGITADQMQMLQKLQEQNPELDFSGAKLS
mmetsp:Transcript_12599/g.22709  ORF Transcript_12599/g.22709 Transcript_12599/m.22709 type:complete len:183 (-) Transcript_12599:148-696(-)|eukprot:CAMPEP_0182448806 /NCGR_PEP_ID=MMETSP1172-20130603/30008_1 /TAXON_ID=708627 /ORGANISM="Timspurckia oligopyrenoides, Strain CCMP3278" /LENGTH=182 /DNA_ID=CAMNT_0024645823 /DNA_START=156 /DNA_END=704 /DNA_ORIENTATION=-